MLLNIFHTGGLTLGISIFFLVLLGIFVFQGFKEASRGVPFFKSTYTWFAMAVIAAYIVVMIYIASDYRGV